MKKCLCLDRHGASHLAMTVKPGDELVMKAGSSMTVKRGNVLLVVMVIMGVLAVLTQQFLQRASVERAITRSFIAYEQARALVLSGFACAHAQFRAAAQPTGGSEAAKKTDASKEFVLGIMPRLNTWQSFPLTEQYDGIEGEIRIRITSEAGKIPLQAIFSDASASAPGDKKSTGGAASSQKKGKGSSLIELKKEYGELLGQLKTDKKKQGVQVVLAPLRSWGGAQYDKKQGALQCRDISDAAVIAEKWKMRLFPSALAPKERAFSDFFSVWRSSAQTLCPYALTPEIEQLLQLKRVKIGDADQSTEIFAAIAKEVGSGASDIWKKLQPLYGAKVKLSNTLTPLFSPEIEHRFYSVLSYATVAGVHVQAVGIFEYVPAQKPDKQGAEKRAQDQFVMRRLYWV